MIINRLYYVSGRLSVFSYLYENDRITILGGNHESEKKIIEEPISLGIGGFDGFHAGHREIISGTGQNKRGIITFHPLPKYFFHPQKNQNIYTLKEKIIIAQSQLGLDYMNIFIFNEDFCNITPESFIEDLLLKRFNIAGMTAGFNFRFGKNQQGDAAFLTSKLKDYGIPCRIIPGVEYNHELVSSTGVRSLIQAGKMDEANACLQSPFFYYGRVVKGKRIGRKIGFPTINIKLPASKVVPPYGVYVSRTQVGPETFKSMSYLGNAPTFENDRLKLETYIDNFDRNIYNYSVKISLLKYLRPERKFDTVQALRDQITEDLENMRGYDEKFQP